MHHLLDEIDIKILELLQTNSRIKRNVIAGTIGLSIPSVTDRLKRLESEGIIESYITKLNHKKVGNDITAFIIVISESSKHYKEFIEQVKQTTEVIECHSITGDGSHMLKIRTTNTSTLEKLLSRIQSFKGVRATRTSIVLTTIKEGFLLNFKDFDYKNK